jgi:putative membrane protein
MTKLTFVCIVLFTLLHVVGARYIYSYVPYKEWSISAGIVNANFFQDTRNHYDRFVHLSFGLLMFPFFMHLCKEWLKLNIPTAILVSWLIIQTGSMIYELFEWLLTVVMTSEEADYYNGQQGDMWDAQKDMALAMVGSTILAICYIIMHKFSHK